MTRPTTSRVKVNPPLGHRPSLENRRIPELHVDPAYQRSVETGPSQALIRRIAQHWDWGLFQPLVVARRPDGTFWVVDGQHRLAAARLRGDMYDIPCVVTQYATPGDEAASLNVQRRPLNSLELFRAALAADDEAANDVAMAMSAAGLEIAPHTNPTAWEPGMLANVGGILALRKVHGQKAIARSLRILARAFDGQVLTYAGTIFPGIAKTVAETGGGGVDDALLTLVLAGASQKEWASDIERQRIDAGLTRPAAARAVVGEAYVEAAREQAEAA